MTTRCPSDLRLEAHLLDPEKSGLARHVDGCESCRVRLERMNVEAADFNQYVFPATVEAVVAAAAPRPGLGWFAAFLPAAAACAAALLFLVKPVPPEGFLAGVRVQLRKAAGGTPDVQTTDAAGSATFSGVAAASEIKDVTAFPTTHGWVTYSSPGVVDMAMFVDPLLDSTKIAGVSGTFDTSQAQPPTGDIKLGLAAFSIAGALSDLNLSGLIGRTVKTIVNLEGFVSNQEVPLPSGVYLKLQNDDVKGRVDMYVDGPCGTGADSCKRILWGLGGQVALSKIGPIISQVAGTGSDVDAGAILSAVLPFFRRFYHSVGGSVGGVFQGKFDLTDIAAPANPDTTPPSFTPSNVVIKPNYLLSQTSTFTVPKLPSLPNDSSKYISGALLLAGSMVPGQGFVPQGLSAGLDACTNSNTTTCVLSPTADGFVSCGDDEGTTINECDGLAAGDLSLDYAPQHDGLEGFRYGAVGVALDVNSLGAGSLFTSVLVGFFDSLGGAGKKTFPITSFLGFNKGAYTAGTTRSYTATSAVDGADFYRLNMDGDGGKLWVQYFKPTGSTFTIEVPPLATGVTGDRAVSFDMQAFKLMPGAGLPSTLDALEEFNSTNFDNLVNYTGAFSTQACTAAYPAKDCAADAECNFGDFEGYTCDGTNRVCIAATQGVTFKGTAACPAGAVEKTTTASKVVCVVPPACEMK